MSDEGRVERATKDPAETRWIFISQLTGVAASVGVMVSSLAGHAGASMLFALSACCAFGLVVLQTIARR